MNLKDIRLLLLIPIVYHFILAIEKGGSILSGIYGDVPCYVSTGLKIIGAGGFDIQTQPLVLPLYSALLYLLAGFNSFTGYLWTWGFIVMAIFILSTFFVVEKLLKNRKLAVVSAIVVGFNWHMGWYGQHLLTDTAVASFAMLAFAVLLYALEKKSKIWILVSGMIAAFSFWTKFSGLIIGVGLLVVFVLYEFICKKYSAKDTAKILVMIVIGILVGFAPFVASNLSRGLVPLSQLDYQNAYTSDVNSFSICREPFSSNLGSWDCGIVFYILRIPYSLGFMVAILAAVGFIAITYRFIKNRKLDYEVFIAGWFLVLLLVYSFRMPFVIEQYVVNFSVWLIIISVIGLKWPYERIALKISRKTALKIIAVIVLVAVITTNSAYPLFIFNVREMKFRDPLFLYNRLPERADNSELYELAEKIRGVDSKNVSVQIGYGTDCYISIAARREMLSGSNFVIGRSLPENATEIARTKSYVAYWRNIK